MRIGPKREIAIIGMAGRFPGAPNVREYWNNLQSGINSITLIPQERWDWRAVYGDPQKEANKTNSKWGGFIQDIDKFDPLFFGISPKEANYIDPQHRIFLETVWQVIENAGYRTSSLSGKKIGVYAGVSKNDYAELLGANNVSAFVSTGTVHSILANRVSHFFNFRGPSEAIDTACSSSLVALHHACRDILEGECEAAIVGGVNALLSPRMYISHAKSGMLSNDGQCKAFDASGDGYVRAEGVAALFLKPFEQAQEDRDNILGIIKSTAINHGGRSNFLTAPSVEAQSEVVCEALRRSGADPRNISFIETHGTGTPLGDPIEINALKKAYAQYFEEKGLESSVGSCGLSSVKTYVGHMESTSGMASIISVLLAMQHDLLPGLFNHRETNSFISMEQSPFYLVTAPMEWKKRRIDGNTLPRQAGVSGFGMGGVNAHVILEEAPQALKRRGRTSKKERLILLSDKKGRLQEAARQLTAFLRSKEGQAVNIDDLAFTLMFGRDEFEERLALVATSTAQILDELERYINGHAAAACVYGVAEIRKDRVPINPDKKDNLSVLAQQWVKGEPLVWAEDHFEGRRIAVPGYQFERIRCWFEPKAASHPPLTSKAVEETFAPTSASVADAAGTGESISFIVTHRDLIVQDHLVAGRKVMPGVGYLDLIARALERKEAAEHSFADIHWLKPLTVSEEPRSIELAVERNEHGQFVRISSGTELHCQGLLLSHPSGVKERQIDLQAIRERCKSEIAQNELYALFFEHGLGYGASFRVIQKLRYSSEEALAEIIPANSEHIRAGLLDGALQAAVCLSVSNRTASQAQYVPYYAETFEFCDAIDSIRYYYVKQLNDPMQNTLRFNLYYCDEHGFVLGKVNNFTKRSFSSPTIQKLQEATEKPILYYSSKWQQEQCGSQAEAKGLLLINGSEQLERQFTEGLSDRIPYRHLTINLHDPKRCLEAMLALKADGFPLRQIFIPASCPGTEDLKALLILSQAVISAKFKQPIKMLYAGEHAPEDQAPALLSAGGFARTLHYEYPRLRLEIVRFDRGFHGYGNELLQELFASSEAPLHEIKYEAGIRNVRTMSAIQVGSSSMMGKMLLKHGGVYLIAGGAGGLGRIFSCYLAQHLQASVVLLGRKPKSEQIEEHLEQLKRLGGSGEYIQADLGDEAHVMEAVRTIRLKYGTINGVLHAGGKIDDAFILRKTSDSFENVMEPKHAGTIHLDRATADDELDFFVMFSSIAALMPNQGQADYASANSFMDAYACHRKQLVASGQRSGLSLAINWPLWAHGGMQVEPEEQEHLWNVFGMQPLASSRGLKLFEEALQLASEHGYDHIVGIEGDRSKINRHFGIARKINAAPELDLTYLVSRDLLAILAQTLRLPLNQIGASQSWHELGVDSLSLTAISKQITDWLGIDFKTTLLFEYGTPQETIDYLLEDRHRSRLMERYGKLGALAPLYRTTGLIDLHTIQLDRALLQRRYDNTEFYQLDHVVDGKYNVPGACYAEMARQAGALLLPTMKVSKLLHCYWAKQLSSSGEPFDVYIQMQSTGSRMTYEIYSLEQGQPVVHATGELQYSEWGVLETGEEPLDLAEIRQRCTTSWTREQVYRQIHAEGLIVGESFMPMQEIVLNEQEALSTLRLPESIADTYDDYLLHPSLLTGVFQTALINNRFHGDDDRDFIPIGIECLDMMGIIPRECYVYCKMSPKTINNPNIKKFNLTICGEDGVMVARLDSFTIKVVKHDSATARKSAEAISITPEGEASMKGEARAIELNRNIADSEKNERTIDGQIESSLSEELALQFLRRLVADSIGLEPSMIVPEEPFEAYGINSILILDLNKRLEESFDARLSKTLFFEYRNLAELTDYFIDEHADMLRKKLLVSRPAGNDRQPQSEISVGISSNTAEPFRDALMQHTEHTSIPQFLGKEACSTLAPELAEKYVPSSRDIAIIGLAGRYPQAETLAEFWDNIRSGKDCVEEIPENRFDHSRYYHPDKKRGKLYSKWGSFLQDVEAFDPMFFNIPPREAELMDPQERIFLEVVWHTLEDAGYTRQSLSGETVGVFVGAMWQPYQELSAIAQSQGVYASPSGYLYSIANRVSYFCNFNGPSLTVDTACSSSLTALHLACQSLITDESSVAIAGGVNVSIGAGKYLFLSQYRFLSTDGKCRSFGDGGDGYVPGEGVGAVLLKRMEDAIKDGDHIYGVIKSTAVNHGGKTNGYTVPNPTEQARVIRKALERSNTNPRAISYIEAHGTGTALGDPIEISGLTHAFSKYSKDKQFCEIGSVKSNIGHLEASAGVAGLTKILLQLKHKQIAPSIHSDSLNPNIDFVDTPFIVSRELREWKQPEIKIGGEVKLFPRIAGISSFGAGGANAHAIIEEYIPLHDKTAPAATEAPFIFLFSAKRADRLQAQARQLAEAVKRGDYADSDLPAISHTLLVGREPMEERLALTAGSLQELHTKLEHFLSDNRGSSLYRGQAKEFKEPLSLIAQDEDMETVIRTWFAKKKYDKLLGLWVKGMTIDWKSLLALHRPLRISLPGYPFAKEQYRFPAISEVLLEPALREELDGKQGFSPMCQADSMRQKLFVTKDWEPCEIGQPREIQGAVAILAAQQQYALALELAALLPQSRLFDANELPEELDWCAYDGMIDLTGCSTQNPSTSNDWVRWLQLFIEHGRGEGLMLLGVTQGLERLGNQEVNPNGGTRAGLYRMLQREYSRLRSCHLDIDSLADENLNARIIYQEYAIEGMEGEVCYRDSKRYRSVLRARTKGDLQGNRLSFPEQHVLWITGGTGGIGLLCAQHFVRNYGVKRLVLTGREELPPRDQWLAIADQQTSAARKIRAMMALESEGATVEAFSLSLSDMKAIEQSLHDIHLRLGPVGGVLHCAGSLDKENKAFIRKTKIGIDQVLEPKTAGLDHLISCFRNEPLQFFVAFSSVSALIPDLAVGVSDYAAGNAYMDYVAEANKLELPIVSLQWPSWKETGIGEIRSDVYQRTGLVSITNQEGLEFLDYVLAKKIGPVLMPAVVNPELWRPESLLQLDRFDRIGKRAANTIANTWAQPEKQPALMGGAAKRSNMQSLSSIEAMVNGKAADTWLAGLFAKELKVEPALLDMDADIHEYGIDSIIQAQMLHEIGRNLNEQLDPSLLMEHRTISGLANYLQQQYAASLHAAVYAGYPAATGPDIPIMRAIEPNPELAQKLPQDVSIRAAGATSRQLLINNDKAQERQERWDIAVVGMSCRLPGADSPEEYWKLLVEGRSSIRQVPVSRWESWTNCYAGLLDDIAKYDAAFFRISEQDAKVMDPQALLLLEECLKLWHQAGYDYKEVKGRPVGVYIGARSHNMQKESDIQCATNPILAVGQNYLAANISQFFDLRGPSVVVDTACSSSLVAMQMSVQALRNGEIESAVVGGATLLLTDATHRMFKQRGILSDQSRFHLFDNRAAGIIPGEGAGLVLLKTVEQALKDGDQIYGVIKGIAVNNNGRTAGTSAPNLDGQRQVLEAALAKSGLRPEQISYVETNGSGTAATDILELKTIYSAYRSASLAPLRLGSMKPNIGHPLFAEGIAAFMKVVLMLHQRQHVPFLSGEEALRHFDLSVTPLEFCRHAASWVDESRIAAVNCFGDGGTNAHVIVAGWEEWSRTDVRSPKPVPYLQPQDVRGQDFAQTAITGGNVWRKM